MRARSARAIVERRRRSNTSVYKHKSWVRQARDTTRWEGAQEGTQLLLRGLNTGGEEHTSWEPGHITDYAHLASQWHPTGGAPGPGNTPAGGQIMPTLQASYM